MQGRIGPPQDPGAQVDGHPAGRDDGDRRIQFLGRVGLFYGTDARLLAQTGLVLDTSISFVNGGIKVLAGRGIVPGKPASPDDAQ